MFNLFVSGELLFVICTGACECVLLPIHFKMLTFWRLISCDVTDGKKKKDLNVVSEQVSFLIN